MSSVPTSIGPQPFPYLAFVPPPTAATAANETLAVIDLYRQVEAELRARWAAIVNDPLADNTRARLSDLLGSLERSKAHVDATTAEWMRTTYPAYYAHGAGAMAAGYGDSTPFAWSQPHRDAVGLLAVDTFDSLLRSTSFEPDTIKATVRELARTATANAMLGGETATSAGRGLTAKLAQQGVFGVTYADGKFVPASSYADMVIRTRTAIAYNAGGLNQARADGVEYFEISDGLECGLAYHDDPQLADGMVVDGDTAAEFPISHPNCVRSFLPRPDLTAQDVADIASGDNVDQSLVSPESRADQQAFDSYLIDQGETAGLSYTQAAAKYGRLERAGRTPRITREPRTPRVPRSLRTESGMAVPTALRNVAGVLGEPDPAMAALANTAIAEATHVEPLVTDALRSITEQLGGQMYGLGDYRGAPNDFRVKKAPRLIDKIVEKVNDAAREGDTITPEEAAAGIHDNLRYTSAFDGSNYSANADSLVEQLRGLGYRVVRTRNTWKPGNAYRGLNLQVDTPGGYTFELQVHTPEGFAVKQGSHVMYEAVAQLDHADPAYIAAQGFMVRVADELAMPIGADRVDPGSKPEQGMLDSMRLPDGGFTIDPRTGNTPTVGFAVAYPGYSSRTVAADFYATHGDKAAGEQIIAGWLKQTVPFFASHPNTKVGGWHDPKTGEIVLDPVEVIYDRLTAISQGSLRNQQAIADLAAIARGDWAHAFIDTGGTGK